MSSHSLAPHAQRLASVLQHLPAVQHAFAYGSGVMHQPGLYSSGDQAGSAQGAAQQQQGEARQHASSFSGSVSSARKGPMVDYILAVQDPEAWHEQVGTPGEGASWVQGQRADPARACMCMFACAVACACWLLWACMHAQSTCMQNMEHGLPKSP